MTHIGTPFFAATHNTIVGLIGGSPLRRQGYEIVFADALEDEKHRGVVSGICDEVRPFGAREFDHTAALHGFIRDELAEFAGSHRHRYAALRHHRR